MSLEWYQCDGCGRRKRLKSGRRHWCRCHPASFRMIPDTIRKLADEAVGMVRGLAASTKGRNA